METLIYILKVNLYCTLFYTCYRMLLHRHTFFRLNRLYLVGTLLLSIVLPLIELTETIVGMPDMAEALSEPSIYLTTASSPKQTDWAQVLLVVYLTGAACMLCRLLLGFYRLYLLLKQGEQIRLDEYTLILLPEVSPDSKNLGSFSFFNFLAVSNQDYENHFDTILRHENVHIKQKHSFDIMLAEAFKVVLWFNPIFWLYKYSLREIHEFQADQQAENKDVYAYFLVSYAQNLAFASITNNFISSCLLKDRIRMIYSKSTSYWCLYKYILVIPVIISTVLMTAARNPVFMNSEFRQNADLTDKIEKPHNDLVQDTTIKISKRKNTKLKTYNVYSSKEKKKNDSSQTKKVSNGNSGSIIRTSKNYDPFWERSPRIGQINYSNRAKIRRTKPFFPAIEKFGKDFSKSSLDLSSQEAPTTELKQNFSYSNGFSY